MLWCLCLSLRTLYVADVCCTFVEVGRSTKMPPFAECQRHFVADIRLGTRVPESIRNHFGGVRARHIGEAVACGVRCDGGNATAPQTDVHNLCLSLRALYVTDVCCTFVEI